MSGDIRIIKPSSLILNHFMIDFNNSRSKNHHRQLDEQLKFESPERQRRRQSSSLSKCASSSSSGKYQQLLNSSSSLNLRSTVQFQLNGGSKSKEATSNSSGGLPLIENQAKEIRLKRSKSMKKTPNSTSPLDNLSINSGSGHLKKLSPCNKYSSDIDFGSANSSSYFSSGHSHLMQSQNNFDRLPVIKSHINRVSRSFSNNNSREKERLTNIDNNHVIKSSNSFFIGKESSEEHEDQASLIYAQNMNDSFMFMMKMIENRNELVINNDKSTESRFKEPTSTLRHKSGKMRLDIYIPNF
jgi:hypothetical protein